MKTKTMKPKIENIPDWWNKKTLAQRRENLLNAALPEIFARFEFRELPELVIDAMEVEHRNETPMTDAEFEKASR